MDESKFFLDRLLERVSLPEPTEVHKNRFADPVRNKAYEESVVGTQDSVGASERQACSEVTIDDGYERFVEQYVQDLGNNNNMDESEFYLDKLLKGVGLPEPEMQGTQRN